MDSSIGSANNGFKIAIISRELCNVTQLVGYPCACAATFIFAQPSMAAPPAGPPRSWSGNGNSALGSPPSGAGPNGQQRQTQAYGAPPSFAPPMGPPSSGNGIGPGSNGGLGGYGGGAPMPRVSSTPTALHGRGMAPPMSAPGQVRVAFWSNGSRQVEDGCRYLRQKVGP